MAKKNFFIGDFFFLARVAGSALPLPSDSHLICTSEIPPRPNAKSARAPRQIFGGKLKQTSETFRRAKIPC